MTMTKKKTIERKADPAPGSGGNGDTSVEEFRVEDRRHWQRAEEDEGTGEVEPARPRILDEYRQRAENAEQKLLEYIEAFKKHRSDQEKVRERLARDVDRRVDLKFGELVGELLETMDDLDLSLEHVKDVPEAAPLAEGVAIARDRFLSTLQKHGVEPITPQGEPFDPHVAEALRVDPVDSAEDDQRVTETLKPGYRLKERVIRAAKVAVGRYGG